MTDPWFGKKGRIRVLWVWAFLLVFFVSARASCQEENTAEKERVLAGLKDRFARVRTFQADYIREIVPKIPSQLSGTHFRAEGKLAFRSPNRLRLDQNKPRKELLIVNGEKAFWYVPEEKTVMVYRLKEYAAQIQPMVNLLSGLKELEKDFSVRLEGAVSLDPPHYTLVLKPRNPQPDLQQINLKIAKRDFLPLEFTYENLMGDGTRFRFSRVRTGGVLADSLFVFTPPAGTRTLDQAPALPAK